MSGASCARFSYSRLKLIYESQIGRVHLAHVVYPPSQKRQTVEAHAKGEALVFRGVETRIFQYARMHHAGSHHLYPFIAQFLRRTVTHHAHIHLDAGFDEREIARPETYLDGGASEKFFKELLERAFEVRERDVFTDREPFYLEKFGFVRHVGRLIAEDLPRHNDAVLRHDAFLYLRFHVPQLYG